MTGRPQVVIIGAGFGGLACADRLAGASFDVTVVDRNNYSTFQPLLYQVATGGLNAADVAYPVRSALRRRPRVRFRWADVIGVDWSARSLSVRDLGAASGAVEASLPFDHLVVAAGGAAEFFGVEGAAEHALPLYSLGGAVGLRNRVLRQFERAAASPDRLGAGTLTVAVVGGGPTGVEVAGALAELFERVFPTDYPSLDLAKARVVLVEAADLLAAFGEPSRRHARDRLLAKGVEVRLGVGVKAIRADGLALDSGEDLAADTVIWAAGVRAAPVAALLGLASGRGGRVVVDERLRVPDHDHVWAIGDVAEIAAGPAGAGVGHLPGLAQVALQGGRYVAASILNEAAGRPRPGPFRYHDKGIMATIGRRAAVVELPSGLRLSGGIAWLAWLGLHLVFLTGLRNRVSVLVNWAWNYVWWNPASRLILGDATGEGDDAARSAGHPPEGEGGPLA
ncbi:MAG TPA: NAD(P)/FAD-dependent oxidoreductase [Acidimicrobiales bacterium]|jgi:NADH dehydrogenase|nr:NAD(P)/FAD-dependent oxidoreductase [Acidimicrobiales bacterium]